MDRVIRLSDRVTLLPGWRYLVELSTAEEWHLTMLNLHRQATHLHDPDPKISAERSGVDVSLMGIRGEYAAARVLGVPFDLASNLDRDLKIADLYLDDGIRVEVKTRGRQGQPLLLTDREYPPKADYLLLCYAEPSNTGPVIVVGQMWREEFLDRHEWITESAGYAQAGVRPEALHPVADMANRHILRCDCCGQRRPPMGPLEPRRKP